jgi:hypothetical protein
MVEHRAMVALQEGTKCRWEVEVRMNFFQGSRLKRGRLKEESACTPSPYKE